MASYSHMTSCDHPRSQPFDMDASEYSPPHTADALKSSRRCGAAQSQRIDDQHCRLTYLRGIYPKKQQKASYEASLLHGGRLSQTAQVFTNGGPKACVRFSHEDLVGRYYLKPKTRFYPKFKPLLKGLAIPACPPQALPHLVHQWAPKTQCFSQISEHSVFTPTGILSNRCTTFKNRQSFLLTLAVLASFLEFLVPHQGRPVATWLIQKRTA